jgi:cyclopropane fatty-acyl-phospholipid synthase-like methyltransferase
MNYGLWNDSTKSLFEANTNLIDFVFDKTELLNKTDLNILDVGCGYGEQDIYLSEKIDKSCKLTAVDISEFQINTAKSNIKNKNKDNISFDVCDALVINEKYKHSSFDSIISIESAFHYSDKNKFFKNVNELLKDETSKFVITDIILKNNKNNILLNLFIKLFSDVLNIPTKNLSWSLQNLSWQTRNTTSITRK